MAVGVNVVEAFDIGALFSLFVAAYVFFQAWNREGAVVRRLTTGITRLALVAGMAVLLAVGALQGLVNKQIKGGQVHPRVLLGSGDPLRLWTSGPLETVSGIADGAVGSLAPMLWTRRMPGPGVSLAAPK
jgi:hypothetical protein